MKHEDETLTDEELALLTAAVAMLWEQEGGVRIARMREVWPKPSPWRWAPGTGQWR